MKTFSKILLIVAALLLTIVSLKSQNGGSKLANIDAFIENQMLVQNKPGLAAVIIKGDSIVWSGHYG